MVGKDSGCGFRGIGFHINHDGGMMEFAFQKLDNARHFALHKIRFALIESEHLIVRFAHFFGQLSLHGICHDNRFGVLFVVGGPRLTEVGVSDG